MEDLTSLPNIGKTLASKLERLGITNVEKLKKTGSQQVFIQLLTIDCSACINLLFALEGAIQGIRWHQLSPDCKEELKEFYHFCIAQKPILDGNT